MARQLIKQQRDLGPKHHKTDPEPTRRDMALMVLAYVLLICIIAAAIVAVAGIIWD